MILRPSAGHRSRDAAQISNVYVDSAAQHHLKWITEEMAVSGVIRSLLTEGWQVCLEVAAEDSPSDLLSLRW